MKSDFVVYILRGEDDPFPYRKALRAAEESALFDGPNYSFDTGGWWYVPEAGEATDSGHLWATVEYHNRSSYNRLFDGAPPVSYDELAKSGEYIAGGRLSSYLGSDKSISLTCYEAIVSYSEEEYNALPPEEQEKCSDNYSINGEQYYGYYPSFTVDLDLYCQAEMKSNGVDLIATIDEYENGAYSLFKPEFLRFVDIPLDLKDIDDYYKAIDFFEQNSISYEDNTAEHRQLRALLASINIVAAFLSAMIALIAVVNMVNILATGILNRRGELAALQCVGMTEKELYKMTGIECLQYALTSGITAVAVCELMMFLTGKMLYKFLDVMEFLGDFISYVQPLPIIGIASLCAFVIAVAASIIPLRAIRRTSLVEQIRSVE